MNKQQIKKYFYAKGVLAGLMIQNFLMLFFMIIISSKDGFELLGLMPIWFIIISFSIASVVYFYTANKEVSRNE